MFFLISLLTSFRRGPVKLGMAKITQVDFPPREVVTYTKETQTPVMTQPKEGEYCFFEGHHHFMYVHFTKVIYRCFFHHFSVKGCLKVCL